MDSPLNASCERFSHQLSQKLVSDHCEISFKHEYLPLFEEARLEQTALFTAYENIDILLKLIHRCGYDLPMIDSSLLVLSVGTSSSQWYNLDRVIGACYIGTTSLDIQPSLMDELLDHVQQSLLHHNIDMRIMIICNSISYFTSKTLIIDGNESQRVDEDDDDLKSAINPNLRSIAATIRLFSNKYAIFSVLKSPREYKFSNKWIRIKAGEAFSDISNRAYLVDFGGGGLDVYSYDPVTADVCNIGKDRFLLGKQDAFLDNILSSDGSKADHHLQYILNFLLEKILEDSKTCGSHIHSCYIYQTGKLRELFFSHRLKDM
jgi:hypothetical protein